MALYVAIALLGIAFVRGGPHWLASAFDLTNRARDSRRRRFLAIAAFLAAFLSLGYVALYLQGGPRAPEAASYWLQGRALAHGKLPWPAPDPNASFRARYLLFSMARQHLAGIFEPGFALLLAPAFLVGAPMLVGPLVAVALVVATWLLAHEVVAASEHPEQADTVAGLAVGLSIVSAALRYHSADVLPYAAIASCMAATLALALRARRTHTPRLFAAAGFFVGFIASLEPRASISVGAGMFLLALGAEGPERGKILVRAVAGTLPGLLLVSWANRASTGSVFTSAAASYFASIEPRAWPNAAAVAGAALFRLRAHLVDVANLEPLALIAIAPVFRKRRTTAIGIAALVVAVHLLVCGVWPPPGTSSTPGAPALVGAIPIEHVLLATGIAQLFPRLRSAAAIAALALSLLGFAVHASHEHSLFARHGFGRPAFEPDAAREAGVTHGLLFFDSDEGYELANDPGEVASHGIEAVRLRNDDHDRMLYDGLGHPMVHKYTLGPAGASLQLWTPPSTNDGWRFEAESDWPPIAQTGGIADILEASGTCPSLGHALRLTPSSEAIEATVTLALPIPSLPTKSERRSWNVIPRAMHVGGGGIATLTVVREGSGPPLAQWSWSDATGAPATCIDLPGQIVELGGTQALREREGVWLVLHASKGPVVLDKTTLRLR